MQTKKVVVFGEMEPCRVQGLLTSCTTFSVTFEAGKFMQNDCRLWEARSMTLLLEHCSLGRTADTSDGNFLYFYI